MSKLPLLLLPMVLTTACADDVTAPSAPDPTTPASVAQAGATSVVMTGLNSPRGLAWGPEGALYVTEAGTNETNGACGPFVEGGTLTERCFSGTGSISRLWKGRQARIVSGLPSSWIKASGFASGPQDISFHGRGNGYVAMGFGGNVESRLELGAPAAKVGTLVRLKPNGGWSVVADIVGFESAFNPDNGIVDSNPYSVLAEPSRTYVVDAGGNSLMEVNAKGQVSLVATFPGTAAPPPFNYSEPVPTRVVRGPDGALYVGTLTGAPFLDGSAAVYRVVPGTPPTVYAGGFKAISDLAFGSDGSLYVLQFATGPIFFSGPGVLIRVAPDGTRSVIAENLRTPTGLAIGPDGALYASVGGIEVGTGEVVRIEP